jgi:hypothetical protein
MNCPWPLRSRSVRSPVTAIATTWMALGLLCLAPACSSVPPAAPADAGPDGTSPDGGVDGDAIGPAPDGGDAITQGDAPLPADLGMTQATRPECNPLGYGKSCMTPYPSRHYLQDDTSTTTGSRLNFIPAAMPVTPTTPDIDPTPFNHLDGYSPATPILIYLGGANGEYLDSDSPLAGLDHLERSMDPTGATVLLDMSSGYLVPHLAEIDASMSNDPIRMLILRPLERLTPNTRYAVAVTSALTAGGQAVPRTPGFDAIVNGRPSDLPGLEALRQPTTEAIAALSQAGTPVEQMVLAWDFTTSSDDQISGWMLDMRNQGLAMLDGATGPRITVTQVVDNPAGHPDALRHVTGTFKAPLFLTGGGALGTGLERDAATGKPQLQGLYDVPFTAVIPQSAATTPTRLFVVGHGLGGSGADTVTDTKIEKFANQYGITTIATDWLGLSKDDLPTALMAAQDINKITVVTDRLQQGLLNSLALTRLAKNDVPGLDAFKVNGTSVLDGTLYYFGASLGGIMGTSLMAYTDDVDRGVVGVAGGVWSTLIQRSAIWIPLEAIFRSIVPYAPERQVLIAFLQMLFDPTDPISVARHVLHDPLPGLPAKKLLLPMSLGDPLVANIASFALSRTLGLPLLTPSVIQIYDLPTTGAPVDSALVVYNTGLAPNTPTTNTATQDGTDAHSALFYFPTLQMQMSMFLSPGGQVVDTCGGPCVPPPAN